MLGFTAALLLSGGSSSQSLAADASPLAAPRIVQGIITWQPPATGALIVGDTPEQGVFTCSGSLIGCNTFITAAHCVCLGGRDGTQCQGEEAPDAARRFVYLQHGGVFAVDEIVVHVGFDFPTSDLAILKLSRPVVGLSPTPLTGSPPMLGMAGTITGFGRTDGSTAQPDFNLKRTGPITVAECNGSDLADQVCWDFTGAGSNTCNGDSGGPLFLNFGDGDVLAGTTSGGNMANCLAVDHSHDVDLFKYLDWIRDMAGEPLDFTSCGAGPSIGDAAVSVLEAFGAASVEGAQRVHTVAVEPGTRELRVTMNARRGGGADFDLYVRRGEAPTTELFDCAVVESGQNAECSFDDPEPGDWFVGVSPFNGEGEYQVTATAFAKVPACADPTGDGVATSNDALFALRAAVDLEECALAFCDVSGDGKLSASDALRILQMAVGLVDGAFC